MPEIKWSEKHRLSATLSYDYIVIGIVSQAKDYKLCYLLNEALNIKLSRKGEIPVHIAGNETVNHYPFFQYFNAPYKFNWYLLANRNHQLQTMLQEFKQMNFFLINEGMPPFVDHNDILTSIRKINNVQMALKIPIHKSNGLNYVLQDLEMYTLEMNRKNKSRGLEPIL